MMDELTQKLSNGEMVVQEIPIPQLNSGMVLVKNYFSLISAGTEGSTVKAARQSLVGKAKARPQQVQQVLHVLKTQGVVQTYRAVTKKLEAYSPLGYSCAGEIIEVADDVTEFKAIKTKCTDTILNSIKQDILNTIIISICILLILFLIMIILMLIVFLLLKIILRLVHKILKKI